MVRKTLLRIMNNFEYYYGSRQLIFNMKSTHERWNVHFGPDQAMKISDAIAWMYLIKHWFKALKQSRQKMADWWKSATKKTIIKIKDGFNQSDDCVDDCVDEDKIFSGILKKEFLDLKDNEGQRLVD